MHAAPERWLIPIVTLAIETGLRIANLCDLQWSEVHIARRFITIEAEKMKNNAYIGIPLTDTAVAVLLDLQKVRSVTDHVFNDDGHPLYYVKIQRALKKALIAAEIEDFHFHDLRHTFASMLVQSGTELYTVQRLLGQKDGRMAQRYAHLSAEFLASAIRNVNGSVTNLLQFGPQRKENTA